MIKILIVDDEPLIRFGIKVSAANSEGAVMVVGDEYNGARALEFLRSGKEHVDCVLTDIKMPVMDGIELIQCIKDEFPEIKVMVLSSYNDIDYVRGALKSGASDYLLKHEIDEKNLVEKLQSMFGQSMVSAPDAQAGTSAALRDGAVKAALTGTAVWDELPIKLPAVAFAVNVTANAGDMAEGDGGLFTMAVMNILEEHLKSGQGSLITAVDNKKYAGLIAVNENEIYENDIEFCGMLLKKYLNITVHIGVSDPFKRLGDIPGAYKEACAAAEGTFFAKANENCFCTYSMLKNNNAEKVFGKFEDEASAALQSKDNFKLDTVMAALLKELLYCRGASAEQITHGMDTFAKSVLLAAGMEFETGSESVAGQNIYEVCTAAKDKLIAAKKSRSEKSSRSSLKSKAVGYIETHYSDAGMSLTKLSEYMNLSVPYLSRLFKSKTGMGFAEYLTGLRMEKAMELIKTDSDMTLQEVSWRVGIDNYNHFSKTFKKVVGVTPSDYKRKIESSTLPRHKST